MQDKGKTDEVTEHRKATQLSGNISDFQLQNLKTWPFIVFDNVAHVKLTWDFTNKELESEEVATAGEVTYNIYFDIDPTLSKEGLSRRSDQLIFWTRYMFWNDTKVKILKEGKKWV